MSIIGVVIIMRAVPKLYTTPMYVLWQHRWRNRIEFGPRDEAEIHWSAILVENVRVDGSPNTGMSPTWPGSLKAPSRFTPGDATYGTRFLKSSTGSATG